MAANRNTVITYRIHNLEITIMIRYNTIMICYNVWQLCLAVVFIDEFLFSICGNKLVKANENAIKKYLVIQ